MKTMAAGLSLVLLVGFAFWILHRGKKQVTEKEFKTTDEFIQYLAGYAVKDASEANHVRLDFSIDSIKSVEQILAQVHDQYAKEPTSISADGLARAYGAYVGEVIGRSNPGARWQKGDEMGEATYPIVWGPGHSYPMAWCYRRITNGPVDNVWDKYNVLKEQKTGQLHVSGPRVVGDSHVWAQYSRVDGKKR